MNTKIQKSKLLKYVYVFVFALLTISFTLTSLNTRPADASTDNSGYLNFQARLLNVSGYVVPDGNYNVDFKLYSTLSTGGGQAVGTCTDTGGYDCLWEETYTSGNVITVKNGYLSVYLGSITAFPSTINWNQPLYLTLNIGGTGGSPTWDGEMSPRIQLTALPYAFVSSELSNTTSSAYTQTLSFGASPTGNENITLPDVSSGVVCINSSSSCGFLTGSGAGVQLQSSTPGTPQTGDFNVSGTGIVSSLLTLAASTDSLDTATAGVLSIGNTSATSITLGANTTVNANKSFAADGAAILEDATNSATAVQIQNASGSDVLNANTTTNQSTINFNFLSPPGTVSTSIAPNAPAVTTAGTAGSITYDYEVVAVDPNGAQTLSSAAGAVTTGNANLSVTNYNSLNITAVSGATNYLIYRTLVGAGGYPSSLGYIGSTTTTGAGAFKDTGYPASQSVPTTTGSLGSGTTYYFKVTALDSTGGQTTPSTEVSKTDGTIASQEAITLSWAPVTGARGYDVYYSTSTNTEALIATTYTNSYTLSALGSPSGSVPTANTAYDDSLSNTTSTTTETNSQITLGNLAGSSSTAQLDVAGSVPTTYVGQVSTGSLSDPFCVAVSGNYAYVADYFGNNLQIFDISNPANPISVGSVSTGASSSPESVVVSGRYAYVADYATNNLQIFDISNPANPISVGTVSTGANSHPRSVVVSGRYVYVADYFSNYLQIFDISNPANPISVGTVSTGASSNPYSVVVSGRYVYVADSGTNYLQIFDISNPANPISVGTVSTGASSTPESVVVSGNYAYVADSGTNYLQIFDISNPANPISVGTVSTGASSTPESVVVSGNYAYVADYATNNLQIFDMSNPANPISVGTVSTGSHPRSVAVSGNYAYVADYGTNTMQIFNLGGTYTQSLQAGSTETTTLQVDGNANIGGAETVTGGLIVGQSEAISGSLSLNGNIADGNALTSFDLPTPDAPIVNFVGTTASTTYSYEVTAVASDGTTSAASLAGTVTTGSASLSTSNYNDITLSSVQGANSYNIYRTAGGAAQGLIGTVTNTSLGSFTPSGYSGTTSLQLTITGQQFTVGQQVVLSGFVPALYNVTAFITATATNTITVAIPGGSGAVTTEGTVTGQLNLADTGIVATTTSTPPLQDSSAQISADQLSAPGTVSTTLADTAPAVTTAGTAGSITYDYEVVAVDPNGAQTLSSAAGAVTTGNANLSVTNYNKLTITAVSGATNYLIYRTLVGAGGYPSSLGYIGALGTSTNIFLDTGLPASQSVPTTTGSLGSGTTYYFKVTALDSTGGQTTPSTEVSKTDGTIASQEAITLSWAPVTGARGYDVYYSTSTNTEALIATTYTNSYTLSALGSPSGSPPTTNTAYNNTLASSGNSQITLGNTAGSASSAQLDVAGTIPTSAVGSVSTGTNQDWPGPGVFVSGNYAYVVDSNSSLQIFDVSNPASPVLVGTIAAVNPTSVYVSGHYAYVLNNYSATLQVIDVSNPTNPVSVSDISLGGAPEEVNVSGRYAYVTNASFNSLQVIDVSNPTNPVVVGTVTTNSEPWGLYIQGRYAYVDNYGADNLQVIDISNPISPTVVGTVSGVEAVGGLYVSGRYAYATQYYSAGIAGLQTIDISNPTNPILVGTATTGTYPTGVYISGHYAYVTNYGSASMQVLDISNPADPVSVGTVPTTADPNSVFVQGNYAYVANYGGGTGTMQIFNLGGAYTQSLQAGSTETTTLQVDGTANIGGSESISGGLIVGQSEAISGSLSLNGNIEDGNALTTTDLPTPDAPSVTFVGTTAATTYSYKVAAVASNLTTSAASAAGTVTNGSASLSSTNYNDIGISPVQGAYAYYVYRTAGGAAQGLMAVITNVSLGTFTPSGYSGTTSLQLTITGQQFTVGQQVVLSGFVPALYNVTAFITATATNTITVAIPGGSGAVTTEGTVTGQLNMADTGLTATPALTAPTVDSSGVITIDGQTTIKTNTNTTTALQIQNAAGFNVLDVDTSTSGGQIVLGTSSHVNAQIVLDNSTNTNTITLLSGVTAATYSLTLPTAAPTTGQCLTASSTTQLAFGACSVSGPSPAPIIFDHQVNSSGTATASQAFTASHEGDLELVDMTVESATVNITSITAGTGCVSHWYELNSLGYDLTATSADSIWGGVITSTGTCTAIAFNYSGSVTGVTIQDDASEFNSQQGSNINWSITSKGGQYNTTSSTTVGFPSLTAAASNEMYYGYGDPVNTGSGTNGTPTGFTYVAITGGNLLAYNFTTTSGSSYAAIGAQSSSAASDSLAIMIGADQNNTFINNTVYAQSANLNVQAASSGTVAGVFEANGSGTGDILDLQNSSGIDVASIGASAAASLLNVNTTLSTVSANQLSAPGTVSTTIAPTISSVYYGGSGASVSYTYEVVAVDANGAQTLPSPTMSTTANPILSRNNEINVGINTVAGATNYLVYRTAVGAGGNPGSTGLICTVDSEYSGVCEDEGLPATGIYPSGTGSLTASTTYYFKVTALDSAGEQSFPSSEVSAATGTTASQKAITLSWAPVTGARGYDVYYGTTSGGEANYFTTLTNSYLFSTTTGNTAGSAPTTGMAYNDILENATSGSVTAQITLGNITGSASTAQLDVAGSIPASAVGSVTTGATPYSMFVSGNYTYVVNQTADTLQVIDTSNPASPIIVATVATGSYPQSVVVSGHYAYVINDYSYTLQVFDISNPTNPVSVATVATLTSPYSITVQGNYAYVDDSNTPSSVLQIFNITNPLNPVSVGTADIGEYSFYAYVQGNYVYTADAGAGGMDIVNVSNPAAPFVEDYIGVGNATSNPSSIYVQGNYAYIANNGEPDVTIINISNPVDPMIVGEVTTGTTPIDIYVSGHYAYVANKGSNDLQVIDVTNPYHPVVIGTINTGTGSDPIWDEVQGNYLYVLNNGTANLQIYSLGGAYVQSLQTGSAEISSLQVDGSTNIGGSQTLTGGLTVGQSEAISGSLSLNGNINDGSALATTDLATPDAPGLNQIYLNGTGSTTYSYAVAAVGSNGTTSASSLTTTVTNGYATLGTSNYNDLALNPVQGASSYNIYRTAGGAAQGLIATITSASLGTFTPSAYSGTTSLQLTITGQQFVVGQEVTLDGFVPTLYNVTAFITNTGANTITIAIPGGSGAVTTEGTVNGQLNLADTGLTATTTSTAPTVDSSGILNVTGYSTSMSNTNSATAFQYEDAAGTDILSVDTLDSTVNIGGPPVFTDNGTTSYVGETSTNLVNPETVVTSGNYAFVANAGAEALASFNISNPANPVYVGENSTNMYGPTGIAISGNYAFVTNFWNNELISFNISTGTPVYVGELSTDLDEPTGIAISGNYAYVASGANNELVSFNISTGTPVLQGELGTDLDTPNSVAISGNYAFVTNSANNELVSFNISTGTPVLQGELSTDLDYPEGITISGNYAFVASGFNNELVSFTISTGTPVIKGELGTNLDLPDSVAISGNYAYVANPGNNELVSFNVSTGIPVYVSEQNTDLDNPETVAISGSYAFVTSYVNAELVSYGLGVPSNQLSVSGGTQLNGNVVIGAGQAGDTIGYLTELDNKTTAGDPTEVNGAMYYNSSTGNFRCGVSGTWENCIGGLISSSSPGTAVNTCTVACGAIATGTSLFPANYCVAGRVIHVIANGVYSDTGTPTLALSLYLGSNAALASDTLLGGTGATSTATGGSTVTNLGWSLDAYIYCVSSTSVWVQGGTVILTSAAGADAFSIISSTAATTITNQTQNLYIFPTWSASSASNTITSREFIVEGM